MAGKKDENQANLSELAIGGAEIAVKVTPKASRNAIEWRGDQLRVYVTAAPADGAANTAVRKLLAAAMGIAPTRMTLLRGATSRDKLWRVD